MSAHRLSLIGGMVIRGCARGPAVADLVLGAPVVLVFVPAMPIAMVLHDGLAETRC